MLHRRASHNKKILAMTEISCTHIVMPELCFVHTVWNQLISRLKLFATMQPNLITIDYGV